ncbi:MAG TPA: flagellar hook assembly protein FlgD [Gammaproteobacteria bacterium]|nr:flagellar hook assembly protein FlgD [Gammaproteobacteria bacterium]
MAAIDNNLNSVISELGLGTQADKTKKSADQLGQTEFLDLMITQLKNQDPFSPMENGDFIAQMAQFSSVTGLAELQQSFDKLATSLQSNQALQASSLVGRTVLVPSAVGTLTTGGSIRGAVDLPQSSGGVGVTIQDSAGQVIRRLELGPQAAGEVYFNWDGIGNDGLPAQPGRYFVSADAGMAGDTVALETLMSASVGSVTLGKAGQGLTLNLTDGNVVDFSSIRQIQ